MATSCLGPSLSTTLLTPDINMSVAAYCDHLHQHLHSRDKVDMSLANRWGNESLAGKPMAWLANELDEPWLRLIEIPSAIPVDPFTHGGWFSLEISVQDTDTLFEGLDKSPFRVIGKPANLDVSDDIRAMQVIGPAGEVLYLTQIKAEVPPFELPSARCSVDRLFIPVLLTENRDRTLAEFERFPGTSGLKFETKITVINRARKLDIEQRHPVATIQLRGKNLVEIDQLENLRERPLTAGLPTGIAVITFAIQSIPETIMSQTISNDDHEGCKCALLKGSAGQLIELIETDNY